MTYLPAPIFLMTDRADEAALARLGAAAVLLWHRIEPDMQKDVLELAQHLVGVTCAPDCEATLARLVDANSYPVPSSRSRRSRRSRHHRSTAMRKCRPIEAGRPAREWGVLPERVDGIAAGNQGQLTFVDLCAAMRVPPRRA